jgi:hypothetical protein
MSEDVENGLFEGWAMGNASIPAVSLDSYFFFVALVKSI